MTSPWSDTSSDPTADVRSAAAALRDNTGHRPNIMVVSPRVAHELPYAIDAALAARNWNRVTLLPAWALTARRRYRRARRRLRWWWEM